MADPEIRLLLVAGRLGPGEAARVRGLAGHLRERGVEATVVGLGRGQGAAGGADWLECPGLGDRWRRPWAVRALALDEPGKRPDLMHVLGAGLDAAGLALAEHWGLPYVLTVDDYIPPGGRLRLSRRWCRALVADGPGLADDLARGLGVSRAWINVIAPGVGVPAAEDAPDDPTRVPVVGCAGPLVNGSGMATFLASARRIVAEGRDVEFVIAGEGPCEADLRRVADRLKIADRITFAAPPDDRGTLWGVLNVFCATSLVASAGRDLASALAHGVPSIVADTEGLRRWIEPGRTGLLVPPGDEPALTASVLGLLDDPWRAAALGQAARERIARDFDPARAADELLAVYRRALAAEAPARPAVVPPIRAATRPS